MTEALAAVGFIFAFAYLAQTAFVIGYTIFVSIRERRA